MNSYNKCFNSETIFEITNAHTSLYVNNREFKVIDRFLFTNGYNYHMEYSFKRNTMTALVSVDTFKTILNMYKRGEFNVCNRASL